MKEPIREIIKLQNHTRTSQILVQNGVHTPIIKFSRNKAGVLGQLVESDLKPDVDRSHKPIIISIIIIKKKEKKSAKQML